MSLARGWFLGFALSVLAWSWSWAQEPAGPRDIAPRSRLGQQAWLEPESVNQIEPIAHWQDPNARPERLPASGGGVRRVLAKPNTTRMSSRRDNEPFRAAVLLAMTPISRWNARRV